MVFHCSRAGTGCPTGKSRAPVAVFLILRPAITFLARLDRNAHFDRLRSRRNDATATQRDVKELAEVVTNDNDLRQIECVQQSD